MTDDLHDRLASWEAPPASDEARRRIEELFDDPALPGPLAATPERPAWLLPLTWATAACVLVLLALTWRPDTRPRVTHHELLDGRAPVAVPGAPDASQRTSTVVSAVDLREFEPLTNPQIRVDRGEP